VSDLTLLHEEEQRLWDKASTAWRPSFPFFSNPRHKKRTKAILGFVQTRKSFKEVNISAAIKSSGIDWV